MTSKNGSHNVARAARLLLALGEASAKGLPLSALAEIAGDAKPAVHRALKSLLETGFVVQNGRRGNYLLGPTIYALAHKTPSVPDIVALMRPKLLEITATTGLSSFLMMRAGLDTVCIDMQPGRILAPAMVEGIGGRVPLGVGMAGVVLLAQMDASQRDYTLAANRDALAAHGLTADQIHDEIEACAAAGYALGSRKGHNFANLSIAFPVPGRSTPRIDAAVSVLAPEAAAENNAIADYAARVAAILDDGCTAP